ncbi:MAG TPA: hypothetical protein PLN21_08120 [Gemmatales bacterium]|nr:hypothetical protein [Gemmatales bacterium]
MTLASDQTVTIERYQPGARVSQNLILLGTMFAGVLFSTVGYFHDEPEYNWAWAGLAPLLLVILIFRLRCVTFDIDPVNWELHREARWAGILISRKTLPASDFTAIQLGYFNGGRESFPVYWAQLIGTKKVTLVESGDGAEVGRVAKLAGELLGLEVL